MYNKRMINRYTISLAVLLSAIFYRKIVIAICFLLLYGIQSAIFVTNLIYKYILN